MVRRPCHRLCHVLLFPLLALPLLVACTVSPPVAEPPVPSARPAALPAPPSSPRLDEAERALFNSDVTAARSLFRAVSAGDPRAENRQRAARRLATIQWRIDADPTSARQALARLGTGEGQEQLAALLELARMERTNGDFAAARGAAARALAVAKLPAERRNATVSLARATVDGEKQRALAGGQPGDRQALLEALAMLRQVVGEDQGRLPAALALLDAAVLLDDRAAVSAAWHSYFVTVGPSGILDPQRAVIDAPSPERLALAQALAATRFFDEAAILAPELHDVARYARFTRDTRRVSDEYYRQVAKNDGVVTAEARAAYQHNLLGLASAAWQDLVGTPFEPSVLESPSNELDRRFGLYAAVGDTGARFNLHAGHRVVDESREVEQYGRRAKIRFIVLDSIISNGYESWLRDGRAEHGGWGDVGLIVQVRPAYASGPLSDWRRLTEPAERQRVDEEIARESPRDDERAVAAPAVYLPGLHARLLRQAGQRLLDELRGEGLSGDSLQAHWLSEYARRTLESSIFAHEGRHAVDAQYAPEITDDAELEYRAKLSEVAFAPDPRLALTGGIVGEGIGSDSPHGKANLRIMQAFVAWMSAHPAEVADLDRQRPLLPQLDKLSDDQLRAVARAIDPWAR
jgi:hypothetical protein